MINRPIIIVGGGLSGLVLANMLSRDGHEVIVIEKRPDPTFAQFNDHRSINLTLSPRGMKALKLIGLESPVKRASVEISGRTVHREEKPSLHQSYGGGTPLKLWAIRREDLHKILVSSLKKQTSVRVLFSHEFLKFDKQNNSVTYKDTSTGLISTSFAKFCVGADGAFSPFRQQIMKGELTNFKQTFFEWSYKQFNISAQTAAENGLSLNSVQVWPSESALIIAIANRDGSFNCNLFLKANTGPSFSKFNGENYWLDLITEAFPCLENMATEIASQLNINPDSGIVSNEVSRWFYQDKAVLIGDACHATYHFFAQGLNSSLEDCISLVSSLRTHLNYREAFAAYQRDRKENTDAILRLSESNFYALKDKVKTLKYHSRHLIETGLHKTLKKLWQPMYAMVAGTDFNYLEAERRGNLQSRLWSITGLSIIGYLVACVLKIMERSSRMEKHVPKVRTTVSSPIRQVREDRLHAVLRTFFILSFFIVSTAMATTKKVVVGLASTLADVGSNSSIPHGDFFRRGIHLALDHQKAELLKKNIEIKFKEFDYGNSRMQVLEIAKEAVHSNAVAVIGYNFSDHALLAAPLHQKEGLALITPTATADRISQMGPYVHQMSFNNSFQAQLLAKLAGETLNAKRVASVVAQDCTYCRDLDNGFSKFFASLPDRKHEVFPVLKGDVDFDDVVKKYKAHNNKYDLIFIPNHELTSAKIILAFLKAGIKGPFLGGDGWANYGGRAFQSMFSNWNFKAYAISHWHEQMENALSKRFTTDYEKAFQTAPNMTAAMAYDSMRYLLTGVLKCESFDKKSIESCLNQIDSFDGVTGHYRFRKKASPEKSLVLQEFKKDRFEFLKVVTP